MPIKYSSRYSVETFDPRFRDVWLSAALRPVQITFSTAKEALTFKNRLQMYRAAVKRQSPDEARPLYRAKCTQDGRTLTIQKHDSEFTSVLDQLDRGLGGPSDVFPPYSPEESATPIPERTPDPAVSFDDLFANIPINHEVEK